MVYSCATSGYRQRYRLWLLACLSLCLCRTAFAQTQPELDDLPIANLRANDAADADKRLRSVAILPTKVDLARPTELFQPDSAQSSDLGGQIEDLLHRTLQDTPFVGVRSVAQVRQELESTASARAMFRVAQESYRIGLDLYLGMQTSRAEESLRRATRLYADMWQDLVDAKPFADAQFMLGVALIEMARPDGPLALRDAFQMQPSRRFRTNFFPPLVNNALMQALTDHRASGDPSHPYGDNRRMTDLAKRLGVSQLVMSTLRPGHDGVELVVAIFDAQHRVVDMELHVPMQEANARVPAFLSRWQACVPITESRQSRRQESSVRVDTSGAYALYLRQPTRKNFHSVGFSMGVAQEFTRNIEWFSRVAMYTSLPDEYSDLVHSFNSVRLQGGLSFVFQRGDLRLFLRPGLDLDLLGSFAATRDANCKLFGLDSRQCALSHVSNLDQRTLAGGHLATGAYVSIGRNFFFLVQASAAAYFLPLDGTDRLNFPVSADVGLGFRF